MVTLKGSYLSPTELTEPLSFQAESLPSIVGDVNMMQSLLLLLKLPAVPLQRTGNALAMYFQWCYASDCLCHSSGSKFCPIFPLKESDKLFFSLRPLRTRANPENRGERARVKLRWNSLFHPVTRIAKLGPSA